MIRCIVALLALMEAPEQKLVVVESFHPIELVCETEVPEGAEAVYLWRCNEAEAHTEEEPRLSRKDFRMLDVDGGRCVHAWAPPGNYEVEVTVVIAGNSLTKHTSTWEVIVQGARPPPVDPDDPPPTTKVDRVTYVYERTQRPVPRGVSAALREINDTNESIIAAGVDKDIRTGDLKTPKQYEIAIEAAKKVGIPALVVQSGDSILKVVKDPKTKEEVLEAIK